MATLQLARAYQHSFETHPNVTLAFTGGSLNALGDAVAQVTEKLTNKGPEDRYRPYDVARTARFFCFGFAISPFLGRWNGFLERKFPLRKFGSQKVSFKALVKRVACDQLVMAPIGLSVFITSMGVMEGRSNAQIQQKFRDLFAPTIITNWKVWPAAQLVNFRFMPLPYRVPFQSGCGVFWTLYLSLVNARQDDKQDGLASRNTATESK